MKKYLYMLRADLFFSEPVTEHTFVLRALPVSDVTQEITRASLTCQPNARLSNGTDSQGNNISLGYIAEKHSTFSFCSTGEVQLNPQLRSREGAYPYYRYPTALTRLSGGLEDYYLTNQISGTPTEKAYHWMDLLSRDLRYEKGVTTTETNAAACWEIGAGVCQDFTHVMLSLLRADGIVCRYVAGLLKGEGATHAWAEYFDGECWIPIDPTHNRVCGNEYMKISHGLDFSCCALERGIFHGGAHQSMFPKCALTEI